VSDTPEQGKAAGSGEAWDAAEQMVSVASFRDPMEAQLARGMLEAAGIDCLLQGQNANALYPGALRVRLQVRQEDKAAAQALLADSEFEDESRI